METIKLFSLKLITKLKIVYPASRGPSIFLDKSGRGRDLPLPYLPREIEGPLPAG